MSAFGQIVTSRDVEQAVLSTLRGWLPVYLRWFEQQTGRSAGALPNPRSYRVVADPDERFPEEQLPAILVVSPGLAEPPSREGDGSWQATWTVGIGVIVSTATADTTREVAAVYTAAVRAAIVQRGALGGIADHTRWTDEMHDQIVTPDRARHIAAGYLTFDVAVRRVVELPRNLPAEPPEDLPGDPPEALTVEVTARRDPEP
jgi:hypothetical protein